MELVKGIGLSCIYMIKNSVTQDFYIGQTKNIQRRHQYSRNYKNCTKLFEDIKKYGWENFEKTVVELCPVDKLDEKELHYITTLSPHYNLRGGDDDLWKVAEVSKERMREAKLADTRLKRQRVLCVETGEVFNSITAAAEKVGTTKISLSRACRGIYKSAKGFTWEYIEE